MPESCEELAALLCVIARHDHDYATRNGLILQALAVADALRYQVGFRIDPDAPEWPVAFIELPTGQVSWHMPQHPEPWDGHTTEEKFARIRAYGAMLIRAI